MNGCSGILYPNQSVAVIDIGSNSVRLVVYEALTRAPTPLFNEKVLCGLGQGVTSTGAINEAAMNRAFAALSRFKALCDVMKVSKIYAIATAAARDATNGAAFITRANAIIGQQIRLLSGADEAKYAALGVISGVHNPQGIVGDMGGGSLELIDLQDLQGVTMPLGGLALQDRAGKNLEKADDIIKNTLKKTSLLKKGKVFYAVGGTFRALAKLHIEESAYPLHVIHNYTLPTKTAIEYCKKLIKQPNKADLEGSRQSLMPYGALLLLNILQEGKFESVVFSALGVREGLLYEELTPKERAKDPLVEAASEFCQLRSRSYDHARELIDWTTGFIDETGDETRLRHAACLLSDVGWRAHPDYRGDQSLNIIANAAFVGLSHAERAYLALSIYFRYNGLGEESLSHKLVALTTPRLLERARLLGGLMRVAYLVSGAMGGTLPKAKLELSGKKIKLNLPDDLKNLAGERLTGRVKALSKLLKVKE
jgi:exopolyphosphatase / guanosine-5'-triphosphate,3'-diphosphate pyrophosphatase